MAERQSPGRRRAAGTSRGRPSVVVLLTVLVPVLTLAALATIRQPAQPQVEHRPTVAPLVRTTLVCPGAIAPRSAVLVAAGDAGAAGEATVMPGERTVRLDGTAPAEVAGRGPLVVVGEGSLAPGLLAGRFARGVGTGCAAPRPVSWFTGVGAGPEHSSVLELVNPDAGLAVADVTVRGPDGPIEVPALRGVAVPGGEVVRFDLAEVVPSPSALALEVVVARGRLGVHVADTLDEVGRGPTATGWLPDQAEPVTRSWLLGVPARRGDHRLVLANPGHDEVRVSVRVVTADSEFAPARLAEVLVAPGAVQPVDLGRVVGRRTARGLTGLRVDASGPVTATTRSFVGGGLVHAVAGPEVGERAAAVLPAGAKSLVLAGASRLGTARVTTRDGAGRQVRARRVELDPGRSTSVRLPARARWVEVALDGTTAVGSVLVGSGGAVLPLDELVRTAQLPDVRPALR